MALTRTSVQATSPFCIKWLFTATVGTATETLTMTNAEILADMILLGINQPNPTGGAIGTGLVGGPQNLALVDSPIRKFFSRGTDAQVAAIPSPPPSGGGAVFATQVLARAALWEGPQFDVIWSPRVVPVASGASNWSIDVTIAGAIAGQPEILISNTAIEEMGTELMVLTLRMTHSLAR